MMRCLTRMARGARHAHASWQHATGHMLPIAQAHRGTQPFQHTSTHDQMPWDPTYGRRGTLASQVAMH